jgi:hypothetical protein
LEFTDAKIENVRSQTDELKSKAHKNKRLLSYKTKNKNMNARYYASYTHVVQLIHTPVSLAQHNIVVQITV